MSNRDPLLGPLVIVGLGGTLVELLGDVAVRVAPLTDDDIEDMLQSLEVVPAADRLPGSAGSRPRRAREVLHGVSALADDLPEIAEMDLNPLFVLEKGAVAADVRVRLAERPPSPPRSAAS